jgi:S-formylglutathione hydrolase FrmB
MAHGYRYWTYISEELPAVVRSLFPLSEARQDNFVAGLSMGGYGAFKLAMSYPERYAAAASLSGVVDIALAVGAEEEDWLREVKLIFGNRRKVAGSSNDLFNLANMLASAKEPHLALYQWCGTEDPLYLLNVRFRDHVRSLGLDLTYEEGPGEHEWGAWDRQIQRVLEWLPLKKRGAR